MGLPFEGVPYTNFHDLNLDWILKNIKGLKSDMDELKDWKASHQVEYQELKDLYDQIMSGNFPDSIVNTFKLWMQKNAADLVGSMIKNVFFGLTDSGYLVAYIPDSWDDIIFNTTGWDYDALPDVDYGHLVLSY